MAKVKIVGIEDKSYIKKETGEVIQMYAVSVLAPAKSDKQIGEMARTETLTAARNSDSIKAINSLGEKVLGKTAFISKGVNSFGGKSYEFVEEFEIL